MGKLIFMLMLGFGLATVGCSKDEDSTGGDGNGNGAVDTLRMVTLDHVDGSPAAGQITAGGEVVFHLRLKNGMAEKAKGITNGFRIYSPDGASWSTTVGDTTGTLGKADFDLVFAVQTFNIDGGGADTVGFGGSIMTGPGLAPGFDDIAYTITIGPIDASNAGKKVCIDSSYYRPSGTWTWAYGSTVGSFIPGWDGPRCFTVAQ